MQFKQFLGSYFPKITEMDWRELGGHIQVLEWAESIPVPNLGAWITQLRTTNKGQATGCLYDPQANAMCCLGIYVGEVLGAEFSEDMEDLDDEDLAEMNEEDKKEWVETFSIFTYRNVKYTNGDFLGDAYDPLMPLALQNVLAKANDAGHSFSEIARFLEDNCVEAV